MKAKNRRFVVWGSVWVLSLALLLLFGVSYSTANSSVGVAFNTMSADAGWVTGPATGTMGLSYTFKATVKPDSVLMPVTDYVWRATDYADPVIHNSDKLSDTMTFNWSEPGAKAVTVTVFHGGAKLVGTHTITIEKLGRYEVYLPSLFNTKPPPYKPVLAAIENNDGDGNYTVMWSEQPTRLSTVYVLQESTAADFPTESTEDHSTGEQEWTATDKAEGTYYYRVRGWNSAAGYGPWSDTQSVTVLPPGPNIRITYIQPKPVAPSVNPKDEYVEIKNLGAQAQNMTGWRLTGERYNTTFNFPSGFVLPSNGVVRVWSLNEDDTATDLYWGTWGQHWWDTSDTAKLYDASGQLVDTYTY